MPAPPDPVSDLAMRLVAIIEALCDLLAAHVAGEAGLGVRARF